MKYKHTNQLIGETSPYLLQHAHNPVNWHPWGQEALGKARDEDKLIFLSIGYAACHWCHVMEHESFENEDVAAILNRHYVSIKVDREERPDLDEIYMSATMMFTGGQGGWPMSVFLAPDCRPVFAGTYFPKRDAYGRPGFKTVLQYILKMWTENGDALRTDSAKVVEAVRKIHDGDAPGDVPSREAVRRGAEQIRQAFDPQLGGISGGTNKFPPSLSMDLLLRRHRAGGSESALAAVETTLEQMGQGGIYDQLGGGIHRYSTDLIWLVPHFEKMLYDQGLVSSIYLDGYQATGSARIKTLCEEKARGIFTYVLRDLKSPEGAFYSSEDADSEGLEGKFFLWTQDEVREVLGDRDARILAARYGVTESGNWNHPGDEHVPSGPKNILTVRRSLENIAKAEKLDAEAVAQSIAGSRRRLFEAREKRIRPGLDDKILSGWNGLMITALSKGAAVLDEPSYGEAAARAANFILSAMRAEGRLVATYGKGRARLTGYLTDYAFLVEGLLGLYEWSGDIRWLAEAESLTDTAIKFYWDSQDGGFFFTPSDHEELIVRSKTATDGAIPSGNSVMLMNLQRLAVLLDRDDLRVKAGRLIAAFSVEAERTPYQHERLLSGIEAWHEGFDEVAIVGAAGDARTKELIRALYGVYAPNKIVARLEPGDEMTPERVPLLRDRRQIDDQPVAYVCRGYACRQPTSDPEGLKRQLAGSRVH